MTALFRIRAPIILLAVLAGLAACQVPTGQPPRGELLKSGQNVFVNGQFAPNGLRISSGDHVATGPSSSALIKWTDGTTVQLAPNTDPGLSVTEGEAGGWLLTVDMGFGTVLIDTGRFDVDLRNPIAEIQTDGTRFIVDIRQGQRFDAYALEGRLLLVRPPGRPVVPGEQLTVYPDGRTVYQPLAPGVRQSMEALFGRFRFVEPRRDNNGGFPGGGDGGGDDGGGDDGGSDTGGSDDGGSDDGGGDDGGDGGGDPGGGTPF
jgi:hypothetical protein